MVKVKKGVDVNPEILIWARETAGLTLDEAAKKLNFKNSQKSRAADKLSAYESGKKMPSLTQLLKMSEQYRRPLLTFYSDRPPAEDPMGEDYRTLPESLPPSENALVKALIRDVKTRQSMVKAILIDEEEDEPLDFIGSVTANDNLLSVAEKVKNILQFDLSEFRRHKTDEAVKWLREKIEAVGVYTLFIRNLGSWHSEIAVELFRGFVLSDDIAPFIVVNANDSKKAQCFTLLHELVHLFLGDTGISGPISSKSDRSEKFCNDVASLLLLPEAELNDLELDLTTSEDSIRQQTSDFASDKNLSRSLVAYRLYLSKKIDYKQWQSFYQFDLQQTDSEKKSDGKQSNNRGGPDYYRMKRHSAGTTLIDLVKRMQDCGAVTPTKAAKILGVKPLQVARLLNYQRFQRTG